MTATQTAITVFLASLVWLAIEITLFATDVLPGEGTVGSLLGVIITLPVCAAWGWAFGAFASRP